MRDATLTIYHNPRCSKSRTALALLRDAGIEPEIILYLETPPTAARLAALLASMGLTPRELMRRKEAPYKELGLDDDALSDAALIERPIVVAGENARLCRPPERVHELIGSR